MVFFCVSLVVLEAVLNGLKGSYPNPRGGPSQSSNLLEIIHVDICGPFPNAFINGLKCFVSSVGLFS